MYYQVFSIQYHDWKILEMFKVSIPKTLLLLIMSTLMLTTAFMPFGFSAVSGPFII